MTTSARLTLALITILLPLELLGQSLPVRRSDNYDPSSEDGRFDLRAVVDGTVDFYIHGGQITYRVRRGSPPADDGSEYRQELPAAPVQGLKLDQRDGRNRVEIAEYPSRTNGWTLVLRVDDPEPGTDRYHARITWEGVGASSGPRSSPTRGPGRFGPPRGHGGSLPAVRSDNYDPNSRDGRFDLRARVDGSVTFFIRGDRITYQIDQGAPPLDEGSEYRAELPLGEVYGLKLDQRDGRNSIRIVEEPSRRNNWTLVLRIEDPEPGNDRYHARITWDDSREPRRR